jgi:hypothetical protein
VSHKTWTKRALILALSLFAAGFVHAGELTICKGKYALCAASTCKPTGKTITTNNGVTYPEVECKCPVLDGPSIADTSAGVMKGSCSVDDPTKQVWSLFAPRFHYPQEANNFVQTPKSATRAKVQACPGAVAEGSANCWGMMCRYEKDPINGTTVARCSCPINQIAKGTEFLTEAGQGDPIACVQHPVAAPDPFADKILNVKQQ